MKKIISIAFMIHLSLIMPPCLSTKKKFQTSASIIKRLETKQKVIALTFDDGPSVYTNDLLKVLKKHDVKATFFLMGQHMIEHPDIVKKILKNGHQIGNHSWSHVDLSKQPLSIIKDELERTDQLINSMGYEKEIFFRPPYGHLSDDLLVVSESLRKKIILWDVSGHDYTKAKSNQIADSVLQYSKPGSIVLFHDGSSPDAIAHPNRSQTIKAINKIIPQLKKQGYRFLTTHELLQQTFNL